MGRTAIAPELERRAVDEAADAADRTNAVGVLDEGLTVNALDKGKPRRIRAKHDPTTFMMLTGN
jgi:hypothetical protein